MVYRNRSEGWQYAKLSGHENEKLVKELLDSNKEFQKDFLSKINKNTAKIIKTSIGGLHETNVAGVNGTPTKSKTDLKVYLDNDEVINVSIKKSPTGQVYFVRAGIFIKTFEKQFGISIPDNVKRAINLFWAEADDAVDIIKKYADNTNQRNYELQLRHKSLNATTLKAYDESLHSALLNWFSQNLYLLAKLSFSTGAVLDKKEWSDYVWYINLLRENNTNDIFCIEDICNAAQSAPETETYFNKANGGTTIRLPFGFVEWHQSQIQFHHSYKKVCKLLK